MEKSFRLNMRENFLSMRRLPGSAFLIHIFIVAMNLCAAQAQKAPVQIVADLSDAPRKLYHAEIDIPVAAGPLSLTSPQWIPGHHMPSGPASQITDVVFTANGQ